MKITVADKIYELNHDEPLSGLALNYMRLLLLGKRQDASQLITNAVKEGFTLKELYLDVFQRTQQEIGYLWETDQINVAKEHYCTAATQMIMAQLYPYIFNENKRNRSAIIACIGGELHELGARMVADFFEMDGWDTYYIGANTPIESLLRTIEEQRPDILGISVTMADNLPKLRELIKRIRTEIDVGQMKIMVGGRLFTFSPELWKEFDVDAFADSVESAVVVANRLVES